MDIKLDINPDAIEAAVKDAIIKSSIGQAIERKVREATNDYSIDKGLEATLRSIISEHMRALIREDEALAAKIKARIVEKLNDEFIESIAEKISRAAQRDY